ncbi:hypothetical protein Hypma_006625 [Hypsizygus marmoreus]|uniref:Uncharacterized protein n=1 Tax=Hypsizygus marmoreus TaxID=39966 RepID=A0A369JX79_HYPMA|nr:hypothetical protein Hypma_006625 [Hypsizygus marmoreus]
MGISILSRNHCSCEPTLQKVIHSIDLGNWHVDGNWFTHFLDSSDQSLLRVLPFNDMGPSAGRTYICEDGLKPITRWLYASARLLAKAYRSRWRECF